MLSFGFPPVSSPSARVLVLGSLPGRLSLERGEYYANPQNAFWKIIAARTLDLPPDYAGRVAVLIEQHIALWDVLAAATRSGSLDAAIRKDAIPNNFRVLPRPTRHSPNLFQRCHGREAVRAPCRVDVDG